VEDHYVPAAPPTPSGSYIDPQASPTSVDPGESISAEQLVGVEIGPLRWGDNISGNVRGLITQMARGHTVDTDAVKKLYVKCSTTNKNFVTAYFPTNIAAIQFVNAWSAAPAPGFESVSVSFSPVGSRGARLQ
jgi:hypothetical protein